MITRKIVPQFTTSDNLNHESLESAQIHEISLLFKDGPAADIAATIVKNKDKIVDVLTTKPNSKVKARSVNGGSKKRTPKTPAATPAAPASEPPEAGSDAN